jgi:hypothetical protein
MFFFSGQTSRREIRKLLSECLFWRFKRAKASRHGSKTHTHLFLFDDEDEETERSLATTGVTPHSALAIHSQNRANCSVRENSNGNYSIQNTRQPSLFTCCGYTIDLSQRHSSHSSNTDTPSRRSTICKSITTNNNNHHHFSPKKSGNHSQSRMSLCISPFDRHLRQQKIVSNESNNDKPRLPGRRRASTVAQCFRDVPSATVTNKSPSLNTETTSDHRSISKEMVASPIEILPFNTMSDSSTLTTGVYNENYNPKIETIDSSIFVQNNLEEQQLPAYIVETC